MSAHPKSWRLCESTEGLHAVRAGDGPLGSIVADVGYSGSVEQDIANGHLIAAAPDLLLACIEVAMGYSTRGSEMARAAIAKATGVTA